ncbi:MAG TPA: transglutaminase-like domain-containing protein [Dehalococcoidia bacterium]|nr:transglutaminase-like domain-containing protein [Dehalococcoidia bacterium]
MTHHREALGALMRTPPAQIDLAYAALLIAQEAYPNLDPNPYLAQLDSMAAELRSRLRASAGAPKTLQAMNRYLFEEIGFRGNTEEYYDPRNSYLNDVLDRRVGIPITVSLIYMEVARRLGIELQGVAMPGHFLVKYARREGQVVIDPFHTGAVLSAKDLRERILAAGGKPEEASLYLAAATKRQIITRMLHNLRHIHLAGRDFDRALGIVEMMLAVSPWDLDAIRDRGLIQYQRHAYSEALRDLEVYLEYRPEADDAGSIWESVQTLRPRVSGQE